MIGALAREAIAFDVPRFWLSSAAMFDIRAWLTPASFMPPVQAEYRFHRRGSGVIVC
jgi:hypothetical protein